MPQELGWFWVAFWELDTCRSYIEGVPYRIPWTAVVQYSQQHEINFEYLWTIISLMDREFVSLKVKEHNTKVEAASKNQKNSGKKTTGRRHGR